MSGYVFETPANIKDFLQATSYQKWSDWISLQNDLNIKSNVAKCDPAAGVEDRYPIKSQYYNPAVLNLPNTINAVISWKGFPRRIASLYPPQSPAMYAAAEYAVQVQSDPFLQHYYSPWQPYADTLMRVQDEYLEWFTTRDTNGNVTKVDFSCEGPEYWANLHDWEPDTCLALYRKYISPDVQLADLEWIDPGLKQRTYNPFNKWNTTQGIMHLNCPPNSLGAEINLAAFASVVHGTDGVPIADPQELIACAKYGNPTRNSDPVIGSQVNALCVSGYMVTCTNPVGLYIQEIDTTSWTRNGSPIPKEELAQIVQIVRGNPPADPTNPNSPGRILRVTVQVPAALGYQLSDISINNLKVQWGGQVAETIAMSLSGTAGKGPVPAQAPQPCMSTVCPSGYTVEEKPYQHLVLLFEKLVKHAPVHKKFAAIR